MKRFLLCLLFLGACSPDDPKLPSPSSVELNVLEHQADLLSGELTEVTRIYLDEVQPIEQKLSRRARDPQQASLAAWILVREGKKKLLSPDLLAAIIQVEDPWLVVDTVSSAGAVGWMQVMPFHATDTHSCGMDLTNGETSICYGSEIFRQYLAEALSAAIRRALIRYNGCVNTPGCEIYADLVLRKVTND